LGVSYCLEAHPADGQAALAFTFDTELLLHLTQALEADPRLPESISLAWAEPQEWPSSAGEAGDESGDYYPPEEVHASLRWLHGLAVSGDPRMVRGPEVGSHRQAALVAELEAAIAFTAEAAAQGRGVRCLVVP
jgi:hypothetical protein